MKGKVLSFAFIIFSEFGHFNGLRPIQIKKFGAGLDREERVSRSDGCGSASEPVADKTSGRTYQVFRRRDNGAVCGSFDWRQRAHGDLILPQTAGSDRSAPE